MFVYYLNIYYLCNLMGSILTIMQQWYVLAYLKRFLLSSEAPNFQGIIRVITYC